VRKILFYLSCVYTDSEVSLSKNEDRERISNTIDNDSVIGDPGRFTTYEEIGYGFTSGNTENEK
jgi:hypothetical protein